jgi:hypothetical protein
MFFFEFDSTPVPCHVGFYCEGFILFSRPGIGEILARALIEIPDAKFQPGQDHSLGDVDSSDRCEPCGYHRNASPFTLPAFKSSSESTSLILHHVKRLVDFRSPRRSFSNRSRRLLTLAVQTIKRHNGRLRGTTTMLTGRRE